MIYKLYTTVFGQDGATTVGVSPQISFLFAPDNTDYQNFKKEVLAGAELQDADGNVMTDSVAYVRTLP